MLVKNIILLLTLWSFTTASPILGVGLLTSGQSVAKGSAAGGNIANLNVDKKHERVHVMREAQSELGTLENMERVANAV